MSAAGGQAGTSPACLVVDANVVIKWHVAEVHTDAALRLLRDDAPALHVPELVFSELVKKPLAGYTKGVESQEASTGGRS
jgi:hypothetical protein